MTEIQIIVPRTSDSPLNDMLRAITRAIVQHDPDLVSCGFLGGEDGYGGNWNSPVFEMRPDYQDVECNCGANELSDAWEKAHPHAPACHQEELYRVQLEAGVHYSQYDSATYEESKKKRTAIYNALCKKYGIDPHTSEWLSCSRGRHKAWLDARIDHRADCALELPNFRHKATGLIVRWYKWIGRDMEAKNVPADLSPILSACLSDIASHTSRHSSDGSDSVEIDGTP